MAYQINILIIIIKIIVIPFVESLQICLECGPTTALGDQEGTELDRLMLCLIFLMKAAYSRENCECC